MKSLLTLCTLSFIALITPAAGQSDLVLRGRATAWPEITLSFRAYCDSAQVLGVGRSDFTLYENGREISDYDLWCPDEYVRSSISAALVLDGSASMAGDRNAMAKVMAHAFVDLTDGVVDELTVTLFNDHAATYQVMTWIKPMLHSAIDALGANGGSALYDALYLSVIEVAFNSLNPRRAVLLITDSKDDSSYRRVDEVIAAAQQHRIPIYIVRLGNEADSTELQMIASETGGRYYPEKLNAGQVSALYTELSIHRRETEEDCALLYRRHCADGGEREVRLEWRAPCGLVADTIRYTAPLDSSTLEPLHLALVGDTVFAGSAVSIPLRIVDPEAGRLRAPFAFTVHYDTSLLQSPRISPGYGSLLEHEPLTVTPLGNGARISTGTDASIHAWIEGDRPLFHLSFEMRSLEGRGDTIPFAVTVSDAEFVDGCPDLRIDDAQAVILAHGPVLLFTGDHPDSLFWNSRSGSWDPPEFDVQVRLFNTGDRDAEDVTLRLDIDESKLRHLAPGTPVQVLPGGRLPAGEWALVTWRLLPQLDVTAPDSVLTGMTIHAANQRPGDCFCRMYFVEGPVSVESPPPAAKMLQLWPNPGRDHFSLALSPVFVDARIIVTDLLGRVVLRQNAGPDESPVHLDLSSQSPGLYRVHVLHGTGRESLPLRLVR